MFKCFPQPVAAEKALESGDWDFFKCVSPSVPLN